MSLFDAARAEWLRARATLATCETDALDRMPHKKAEAAMSAALDAVRAAEWKLLQTPARDIDEIRDRAEIVLEMFAAADKMGRPTDNRHRLMLAGSGK